MRAAVHRGEDADIVAGRHAPIGTADAVKGRGQIEVRRRGDVDAERVVLGEITHAAILGMDMLARLDRRGRKADDLAIAAGRPPPPPPPLRTTLARPDTPPPRGAL